MRSGWMRVTTREVLRLRKFEGRAEEEKALHFILAAHAHAISNLGLCGWKKSAASRRTPQKDGDYQHLLRLGFSFNVVRLLDR